EQRHESTRIFPMRVAAHRRFVDTYLGAALIGERLELTADNGKERTGNCKSIGISIVRNQASAERVRAGHAGLQRHLTGRDPLEPPKLLDHAQPARSAQLSRDSMLATLVVSRRAKAPVQPGLGSDTRQKSVKR